MLAARHGIALHRLSVSYALEALHNHHRSVRNNRVVRGGRAGGEQYDRSTCDGALDAILNRPIYQSARAQRSRQSVRASLTRLKAAVGIDASGLRVVHVAGSKGKGSTCKFLESILRGGFGVRTG